MYIMYMLSLEYILLTKYLYLIVKTSMLTLSNTPLKYLHCGWYCVVSSHIPNRKIPIQNCQMTVVSLNLRCIPWDIFVVEQCIFQILDFYVEHHQDKSLVWLYMYLLWRHLLTSSWRHFYNLFQVLSLCFPFYNYFSLI